MKHALALALTITTIVFADRALGDRGMIVSVKAVDLQEPAQRAIVAHNGTPRDAHLADRG